MPKFDGYPAIDALADADAGVAKDASGGGTKEFTFAQVLAYVAATAATLTNKTINGASNTLTARIANDVSGLAAGIATFLGAPSGANLAAALTSALPDTKGGTGLTALAAGIATWLGTPSGANLASALTSALPDTKGGTGLSALGTGVATFLGTPSGANLASALTTALPLSKGGTGLTAIPGSDTYVFFNDGGAYGADAGMVYNKTTDALTLAGALNVGGGTLPTGTNGIYIGGTAAINFHGSSADYAAISMTLTNNLDLGVSGQRLRLGQASNNDGNLTVGGEFIYNVGSAQLHRLQTGGTDRFKLSSSVANVGVPIIGLSTAYGSVNASGTQAMADANQTPALAVYQATAIVTTGALTATRTLTLPTATDAQAYPKWINNTCTGAFAVTVKCASGTTVDVANGKSALVWIDSRGVTRMTADV